MKEYEVYSMGIGILIGMIGMIMLIFFTDTAYEQRDNFANAICIETVGQGSTYIYDRSTTTIKCTDPNKQIDYDGIKVIVTNDDKE